MVSIKKIFIAIVAAVAVVNAAVLTHQATFDDVKVIAPAKSTKTTCKTRVDLSEGLVDNTLGCDIEQILVYNKNRMWIGSLDGVPAGYHSRYNDYDVFRYRGKGHQIKIEYAFTSQDADPSNSWMVSCPKGMIAYIDEDYYRCKRKYACPAGMYAIDSIECAELQAGAHRNPTIGFSCNKGYVMHPNGYCIEKPTCEKDEVYDKTENSCLVRPEHSHWIKNSIEWECNDGYVVQGDSCEEVVRCDSASRYDEATNTCVKLPMHAHWNDSVSNGWTCDIEYIPYGAGCIEKAICSSEQRYDASVNICIDPFPHSRWTGLQNEYTCDAGYVDMGYGSCVKKADCTHYNADDNSCYEKPEHSHWLYSRGNEWECDEGFHHGFSDELRGVCFKCDGETQFDSVTEQCVTKPDNAEWISEGSWECRDGYVNINGHCEEKVSCWFGKRYNEQLNQCVSKPSHAHWSDSYSSGWECDYGYYESYGECEDTNPIHLSDYIKFSHSLTYIIGGGDVKDNQNVSTMLFNTALEYGVGLKVGTDFFDVRPQAVLGLLYNEFEYSGKQQYGNYLSESVYSTAFVVGINVGIDVWHFTIDYSYLYANREELSNIDFCSTLHQFKVGFSFNEHWNVNITSITQLIEKASILKEYDNTIYNIGVTYVF